MRKVFVFLTGLFFGVLTGGILSLLLAPQAGPEFQNQIRHGIEHLVEEGKNAAEVRRQELESQLESFKQGRPITLQTTGSGEI